MMKKSIIAPALILAVGTLLQSCSLDAPFGDAAEGNLTITTEINGDVIKTRSISADELSVLREKCVVYIENDKGIIRRYRGVDNIPENIKLQTGSYVVEAWSGDSVSASFDKKFYRGWERFQINEGQNSLTLKCNIANVLASVDPASLNVNLTDLKVTFYHSCGELEFTEANIPTDKGYFMMPNADKDLQYRIEGKKADGSAYTQEGKINNVERAHEYCMTLTEEEKPITEGGALIRITIADIPLIEQNVEIFPAPAIRGVDFNIDEQIVSTNKSFTDARVYVRGYFGLSSIVMTTSAPIAGVPSGQNILEGSTIADLTAAGIRVERRESVDASAEGDDVEVGEVYVTFSKAFLDALPASDSEYQFTFEATDGNHRTSTGVLKIANTDAAITHPAPIGTVAAPDPNTNPMAIGARSAVVSGAIYDTDAAQNFGIKYRVQGTSQWNEAYPTSGAAAAARRAARATRADGGTFSVTLTGLQPGTTYEYKAFCNDYDSAQVMSFTTESIYQMPDASFEEWSTYSAKTLLGTKNVILPGNTGDKLTSFWGSGNEGAATANMVICNKSTDMTHSGQYSARLNSTAAAGKLAAGNIFVGYYVKTDGTDGVLSLGRQYNGSHPSKLRVYANYRPGTVNIINSNNVNYIDVEEGGLDHGQIYVALTDDVYEIRTKSSDRKLFDVNDPHVLAYGQVTWKNNFGPDGQLQLLEIPIVYNERAKTKRPTHIVIVASASKFGDYFSGSQYSVMYLDDFEFVYE